MHSGSSELKKLAALQETKTEIIAKFKALKSFEAEYVTEQLGLIAEKQKQLKGTTDEQWKAEAKVKCKEQQGEEPSDKVIAEKVTQLKEAAKKQLEAMEARKKRLKMTPEEQLEVMTSKFLGYVVSNLDDHLEMPIKEGETVEARAKRLKENPSKEEQGIMLENKELPTKMNLAKKMANCFYKEKDLLESLLDGKVNDKENRKGIIQEEFVETKIPVEVLPPKIPNKPTNDEPIIITTKENTIESIENLKNQIMEQLVKSPFNYELIAALKKAGINISCQLKNKQTLLHLAIYARDQALVNFLLKNGADQSVKAPLLIDENNKNFQEIEEVSPVELIAKIKKMEEIKELLANENKNRPKDLQSRIFDFFSAPFRADDSFSGKNNKSIKVF